MDNLVQFKEDFNSRTEIWWSGVGWGWMVMDIDHVVSYMKP